MLLADAADAADTGALGPFSLLKSLWADPAFRLEVTGFLAAAFWSQVWPRIKDERIKVRVWVFRPSARIGALKWVFEKVFGPQPVTP